MVSLTIRVDEPSADQLSAVDDFLRTLKSGAQIGPEANAAAGALPMRKGEADSYTSDERSFEREKIALFRSFERADWKISKNEIRALNKSVFKNVRRAAALYSDKAGYFSVQGDWYVASSKAKEELKRWNENEKQLLRSNLPVISKDGTRSAALPTDPRNVDVCD